MAVASCGTEPGDRNQVSYIFDLSGSARDSTPERLRVHSCGIHGSFTIDRPERASGTVRFPVSVDRSLSESRGMHQEYTSAHSTIAEAVLEYHGLGEAQVEFTFGVGSHVLTSRSSQGQAGQYSGDWTCSPDVPLAGDSTLNAYGYDPNLEISGLWQLQEILPFE